MTTDAAAIPNVVAGSALQLRQDDPVSLLYICKTMGLLVLLLVAVYLLLRWYAQRQGQMLTGQRVSPMQCVQALRLSARTKVYLLDVEGRRVLVTEAASGTTALLVSETGGSQEPGQ